MTEHLLFYALSAAIVVGTMALAAGLGLLVARFATVHWLQVMGQVIAVIAASLGLFLPLLIMLTAPAYEEGETTIISYARVRVGASPTGRLPKPSTMLCKTSTTSMSISTGTATAEPASPTTISTTQMKYSSYPSLLTE